MENIKLFRLFKVLDSKERSRFERTLNDKPNDIKRLFSILKKHNQRLGELKKEDVIKQLRCDESEFNYLTSSMDTLIENFIINNELNMNDNGDTELIVQRELILLNYFRKKPVNKKSYGENLSKLFSLKMAELDRKLKKISKRDIFYYIDRYKLYHYVYYCNPDLWEDGKPKIEQILRSLDIFYCLAKLRSSAEAKARQSIFGERIDVELLYETHQLSEQFLNESPLVEIYRRQLDLFQDFSEDKLITLKDLIVGNKDKIIREEMAAMLSILLNHIVREVREGNTQLNFMYYSILKFILDNDYFINKGLIRPLILVNFSSYCMKVERTDEITPIIEKYRKVIPKSKYQHTKDLCEAYVLFGEESYYAAYKKLENVTTKSLAFILHKKTLQLKCLYEFRNPNYRGDIPEEMLHEACPKFKKYIRQKKHRLSVDLRSSCIKFADMLIKMDDVNVSKTELFNMLSGEYYRVVNKDWLLEKIEQKK